MGWTDTTLLVILVGNAVKGFLAGEVSVGGGGWPKAVNARSGRVVLVGNAPW